MAHNHLHDPGGEELVIERVLPASREAVWKAWTEPELIKRWWGPEGFTAPVIENDLRVGGKYLYCMRGAEKPGGEEKDYWTTGVYREIVPDERIVSTDSFADSEGKVVPATHYGMSAEFPLEMLLTVIFEEQDKKTKLTIRHDGIPASDIEGARAGWGTSLDKLARVLK